MGEEAERPWGWPGRAPGVSAEAPCPPVAPLPGREAAWPQSTGTCPPVPPRAACWGRARSGAAHFKAGRPWAGGAPRPPPPPQDLTNALDGPGAQSPHYSDPTDLSRGPRCRNTPHGAYFPPQKLLLLTRPAAEPTHAPSCPQPRPQVPSSARAQGPGPPPQRPPLCPQQDPVSGRLTDPVVGVLRGQPGLGKVPGGRGTAGRAGFFQQSHALQAGRPVGAGVHSRGAH